MRLHAALSLLLLAGCSSVRHAVTKPVPPAQAPTLRTRPAPISGPHYVADIECLTATARKNAPILEWYSSPGGSAWCDEQHEADGTITLTCHDVVFRKLNSACMKLVAK